MDSSVILLALYTLIISLFRKVCHEEECVLHTFLLVFININIATIASANLIINPSFDGGDPSNCTAPINGWTNINPNSPYIVLLFFFIFNFVTIILTY